MTEAWIGLLGSVLVAAITYLGVVHQSRESNKETLAQLKAHSDAADAKMATAQAVTDTKLEALTLEVRKHNNFAERIPVLEEQMKVANHRISDLEHSHSA